MMHMEDLACGRRSVKSMETKRLGAEYSELHQIGSERQRRGKFGAKMASRPHTRQTFRAASTVWLDEPLS